MTIGDMSPGTAVYAALDVNVLAVISRRSDGWCIYIGAVRGKQHSVEWPGVAATGNKVYKDTAIQIAKEYFGLEVGNLRYAR